MISFSKRSWIKFLLFGSMALLFLGLAIPVTHASGLSYNVAYAWGSYAYGGWGNNTLPFNAFPYNDTVYFESPNPVGNICDIVPYDGNAYYTSVNSLGNDLYSFTWNQPGYAGGNVIAFDVNDGCSNGGMPYGDNMGSFITLSDTSPTPVTPTIAFTYPAPSSTNLGLFSNWLLEANNLNASGSYEAEVKWYVENTVTGQPISGTNLQNIVGDFNNPVTSPWYATVTTTPWSVDFAYDVTLVAEADLLNSQDPNNPGADLATPIVVASTTDTWTLLTIPESSPSSTLGSGGVVTIDNQNASGTVSTSTTSGDTYYQATDNVSTGCVAPQGNILEDFNGNLYFVLCNTKSFFLNADPWATDLSNSAYQNFIGQPPFNWFFNLASTVSSSIASANASSSQYRELDYNASTTAFGNSSFVVLSSSTLSNLIGTAAVAYWFQIYDYILAILFGLLFIGTIFLIFKRTKQ